MTLADKEEINTESEVKVMYKCLECGHIFEDGEEARWSESRVEPFSYPGNEEMSGCPLCHGDYEECKPCTICGRYHIKDETNNGVCDVCIDQCRYDPETCYKVGKKDTEKVNINCFLATIFNENEINEILYREMQLINKYALINCNDFIDADSDWFADMLEEVKKSEKKQTQIYH